MLGISVTRPVSADINCNERLVPCLGGIGNDTNKSPNFSVAILFSSDILILWMPLQLRKFVFQLVPFFQRPPHLRIGSFFANETKLKLLCFLSFTVLPDRFLFVNSPALLGPKVVFLNTQHLTSLKSRQRWMIVRSIGKVTIVKLTLHCCIHTFE